MELGKQQIAELAQAVCGDIRAYTAANAVSYRFYLRQTSCLNDNGKRCQMGCKGLTRFQMFDVERFFRDKTLVYVKAEDWDERNDDGAVTNKLGSKVTVQIIEDKTDYGTEIDNFGAQIAVKVRSQSPAAYAKLKPLASELIIKDVEKATVWGEYRNELSIIAQLATKNG